MSSFTKTVTEQQLEANQANALKSTGPITPEGKAKASQNRTVHGLCGSFRLLSWERQDQFDALVAGFMESEQPANACETELVVKMAEHHWRARRALRLQDACFEQFELDEEEEEEGLRGVSVNPITLQTAMRYHTLHDRAYQRAAKELMERRKQRQLAENGFERKKQAEAEAQRKAEKHEIAIATAKVRHQFEEMRATRAYISTMNRTIASPDPKTEEFAVMESRSAA